MGNQNSSQNHRCYPEIGRGIYFFIESVLKKNRTKADKNPPTYLAKPIVRYTVRSGHVETISKLNSCFGAI
jgi:hypothetical protein